MANEYERRPNYVPFGYCTHCNTHCGIRAEGTDRALFMRLVELCGEKKESWLDLGEKESHIELLPCKEAVAYILAHSKVITKEEFLALEL